MFKELKISPTQFQTSKVLQNYGNKKFENLEKQVKTVKIRVLGFTFVASHHIAKVGSPSGEIFCVPTCTRSIHWLRKVLGALSRPCAEKKVVREEIVPNIRL